MESIPENIQAHLDSVLGIEIRKFRLNRERSQSRFAEAVHCSDRHLVEIEAGRATPSYTLLLCVLASMKPEQQDAMLNKLLEETRAMLVPQLMRRDGSLLGQEVPA